MKRRVLVILRLKEWKKNGDCLRVENIFGRLSSRHDVHALLLKAPGDSAVEKNITSFFTTVAVEELSPEETFPGRLKKFLAGRPFFDITLSDPGSYGRVIERVRAIIRERSVDLVHAWLTHNAQFVVPERPALCDMCDSYALTFRNEALETAPSLRNLLSYSKIAGYERTLIRRQHTCFVSKRDAELLRVGSEKCHIIPNGVDSRYFSPITGREERTAVVFSGDMCFRPNVQAAVFFSEKVFPLIKSSVPDVRWYIVGGNPAEEIRRMHDGSSVIVTGYVPDMRDELARAAVVVCPMVSGLGIKNKALEAMSMAKPVVATRAAASGIEAERGKHLFIEDDPVRFADSVKALLGDEGLRKRTGEEARGLVTREYSWENAVARYEEVYGGMLREFSGREREK